MAQIKTLSLVDLYRWDNATSQWLELKSKKGGSVVSVSQAVLSNTTFNSTTPPSISINWGNFTNGSETGHSIFGSDTGLIPATHANIKLRYKIQSVVIGSPDYTVVTENKYMFIKLGVPASQSVLTGLPVSASAHINATIVIRMAAVDQAMLLSGETVASVLGYYTNTAKWMIRWTNTTTGVVVHDWVSPTAVALGSPTVDTEYGSHRVPITLTRTLNCPTSGTYKLEINFIPNDGGTAFAFSQMPTTTVTISSGLGGNDGTIFSADETIVFSMTFGD